MEFTKEQLAAAFSQLMASTVTDQPAKPKSSEYNENAPDFIPTTLVYEHERQNQQSSVQSINNLQPVAQPTNTYTPIEQPQPQQPQSAKPYFVLAPMEADLTEVLRHLLNSEGQTLFTVENVFIQQLLRIFHRIETRLDSLEELITDELLGASKDDDDQSQPQLVFQSHGEEENNKEEIQIQTVQNSFVDEGERIIQISTPSERTWVQEEFEQHQKIRKPLEGPNPNVPRGGGEPPREKGNARKRRRRKRNRKNKR